MTIKPSKFESMLEGNNEMDMDGDNSDNNRNNDSSSNDRCLVILSGGQDSTTCAAIAASNFKKVHAVTFNYGQKHSIEIQSAIEVAKILQLESHEIIDLGEGILKGSSPLINERTHLGLYASAEELPDGIEPTFVYGRNILFLTVAANRAAVLGVKDLYVGLCQADFAGYPDCRQVFVDRMSAALGEGIYGNGNAFKIHVPLMDLTKSESVILAKQLLKENFDRVMARTHTCYAGVKGGCGKCHACLLRDRGFQQAGIADPLWSLRGKIGESEEVKELEHNKSKNNESEGEGIATGSEVGAMRCEVEQ